MSVVPQSEQQPGSDPSRRPSPEEIGAELARILDSPEFSATPRRRQMLKYLVEETLAGDRKPIKGYAIGVAVFGREEGYDPQLDPVVRMEARRLRRDLDSYYSLGGRNNPLRISIPKGQYVPEIYRTEPDHPAVASPSTVITAAPATTTDAAAVPARGPLRWIVAAALAAIVIVAGLSYLLITNGQQAGRGLADHEPTVAVLPFSALSTSQDDSFLGIGIAGQIVSELSRFADFRLYSWPAINGGSNTADPAERGKELGVDYVVVGDVRSEGSLIRIMSRMVDTVRGEIIWTETYERESSPHSLLTVQGEIATGIAATLGQPYGVIRTEITDRLSERSPSDMASYECVLRGYAYRRTFPRQLHAPVLACLEATVRRDPDYAEAWALLGWLHLDTARFRWAPDSEIEHFYQQALDAASHAVILDGKSVLGLKALSAINHYLGNYDDGERYARQALTMNPNDPDTLAQLGWRLAVRGNFDEGIPYLRRAIGRSVNPPGWYYHLIAVDHYMQGRYAEMLTAAGAGNVEGSGISWSFVAIANGALGNKEAADEALTKMAETSPQIARDPAAVYRRHGATEAIVDALVGGLRKAGWTEPDAY